MVDTTLAGIYPAQFSVAVLVEMEDEFIIEVDHFQEMEDAEKVDHFQEMENADLKETQ
jgi:hypothetical protein